MLYDPATYLRQHGLSGSSIVECVACPAKFKAEDGIAMPAVNAKQEPIMAAFCSHLCYLKAFPPQIMWRA